MLPWFTFIHEYTEDTTSLRFKRRQFPIRIAFAITINKCKRQTFKEIGIYLDLQIFSHNQLYVAFSRVLNLSSLHVLIRPINKIQQVITNFVVKSAHCTYNVVYKEVLDRPLNFGQIPVCFLNVLLYLAN